MAHVMAKVAWGIKSFPKKASWFKRGVEALPSLPGDWSCCTSVSISPLQSKGENSAQDPKSTQGTTLF